ncbi:MAG: hypothetical protein OER77_16550, partial [Myxococcales bacterium]|nr:hypothetical protein [Myxococcales bacterium]
MGEHEGVAPPAPSYEMQRHARCISMGRCGRKAASSQLARILIRAKPPLVADDGIEIFGVVYPALHHAFGGKTTYQ